jgi:hypothetical protein
MKPVLSSSFDKYFIVVRAPVLYLMTLLPGKLFDIWMSQFEAVLLVYQMGKVASSSMYRSLKNEPAFLTLQFHMMPGENSREFFARSNWKIRLSSMFHLLQGVNAQRLMQRCPQKVRIITLVRDPFSRNLSAYFQNLHRLAPQVSNGKPDIEPSFVAQSFLNTYDVDIPLKWFDLELFQNTGIDVFSLPFDAKTKAGIYFETKFPLLIMRTDLSDEGKLEKLKEFLAKPVLKIREANRGEEKRYDDLYQRVKQYLRFPPEQVDYILQSKLMTHFYSHEERQAFARDYRRQGAATDKAVK